MLEKLKHIENRYAEIEKRMESGELYSDPAAYAKCAKEMKELEPVVAAYREYSKCCADMDGALELMSDPEFKDLAHDEFNAAKERKEELEEKLRLLLLPKDPNDEKNIIMEIRAGTGGEEAGLFAADLYRMYCYYAESMHWKIEEISSNATELGGYKEMIVSISGKDVYGSLRWESGVHRVQRIPVTESGGRIQTSAVTVAVLPEAEETSVDIRQEDLRIDVMRAGGPGGQCVNTTESAVRITHIPTGLVVICQNQKSQIQNRVEAMRVLRSRLYDLEASKKAKERADERKSQVGSGDRSERIRTYNFPQNRLTDHRINLTLYNLDLVMEGKLEPVIEALKVAAGEAALRDAQ